MNKGIELLLARMDSNPDEFMGVNNKWSNLIESHEDYMTDEDRKALFAKLHELRMGRFTEHVMKKLLAEQDDGKAEIDMYTQQVRAKMQQNAAAQQQYYYNNAQNQVGGITGLMGALGSATASSYANTTTDISTSIQLGKQTLTERTLKKLKALTK